MGEQTIHAEPLPDETPSADAIGDEMSRRQWLNERLPVWLFIAGVVAALPLVLFVYGADNWFLRDEWFFLTDRGRFPPLLEPSAGAHWVMIPRLIYLVLWKIWGVTTYVPYQLANVLLHLLAVVMLREVIRRSGVNAWLATAAAAPMLLFGPGFEGIVLAFQVGFTGSLAWGLVQLVVADSEGGFKRRDLVALGFGFLAITSSGVGVTTTVVVGIAVFLRRGWRMGLLQSAPLLLIYFIWSKVESVKATPVGRPPIGELFHWDLVTITATFKGVGHFPVLAWAMVGILVVGAALALGPWREQSWSEIRRDWAMPVAMFLAIFLFATTTGVGRSYVGDRAARSSRYVYLQAFLLMPMIAICAQAIARRWRQLTPVLVTALLLPIPFNLSAFDQPGGFNKDYFAQRKYILTTAVRMPFARDVPSSVRPVPDAFDSDGLTIGFLLGAEKIGKLNPSTMPLNNYTINEFRIRLGFHQTKDITGVKFETCAAQAGSFELELDKGDAVGLTKPFRVHTIDELGGEQTSPSVLFNPDNGRKFTAELPDLKLRVTPEPSEDPLYLCEF